MRFDLAPRDIGRLADDAILLYRANFRPVMQGALAVLLPAALLSSVAGTVYNTIFLGDILNTLDPDTMLYGYGRTQEAVWALLLLQAVAYLAVPVSFIANVWIASSVFRSVPEWLGGGAQTMREFLGSGRHRFLPLVGVELLVALIGGAAAIPAAMVYLLGAFVGVALTFAGVVGAIIGVGVMVIAAVAAFLLWVVIMARFQAWGPASVTEGTGVGAAFSRTMELMKGRSRRTVWYWFTVWMVGSALRALVAAPAAILPLIQEAGAVEGAIPIGITVALGVSTAVAEALVRPLERTAWSRYYLDLRSRAEGMDLVLRARELAAATR